MNTFYIICFVIFLMLVQVLALPIKPLEIATGMAFKNFWMGFVLVVSSKFLSTFPGYFISKYIFKKRAEELFSIFNKFIQG